MSVSSTKALGPGDTSVTNAPNKLGAAGRAASPMKADEAVQAFQVDDHPDQQNSGEQDNSGGSLLQQRQRGVFRDEFTPLLNRAAAFSAHEPPVGGESGPVIRVFFADVVRGVRSYEFSMHAIAANDRSSGLQRGSNYNRYY